MSIAADFGEIEAGLRAIHGAAIGLVGVDTETVIRESVAREMEHGFEFYIDTVATSGEFDLAHVYEWGHVGEQAFRLFDMRWQRTRAGLFGDVQWLQSEALVPLPPEADESKRSRHIFPWKASILEEGPDHFRIRAGITRDTVVTRPGGKTPRVLTWYNRSGKQIFSPRATISNPHAGEFHRAWRQFFSTNVKQVVLQDVEREFTQAVSISSQAIQTSINTSRVTARPRISPNKVVNYTVNSRPMRGLNVTPDRGVMGKIKGVVKRLMR